MRFAWLVVAWLVGCGPAKEWHAGMSARVLIDPQLTALSADAKQAAADRLDQFGISIGEGSKVIRVSDGSGNLGCQTSTPGAVVAAYTTDRIWVCPRFADATAKTPRGAYLVLSHEMGHLLGLVGHLPAGGNLMAPILDNYKTLSAFSARDVAAICGAGHVDSPACD